MIRIYNIELLVYMTPGLNQDETIQHHMPQLQRVLTLSGKLKGTLLKATPATFVPAKRC